MASDDFCIENYVQCEALLAVADIGFSDEPFRVVRPEGIKILQKLICQFGYIQSSKIYVVPLSLWRKRMIDGNVITHHVIDGGHRLAAIKELNLSNPRYRLKFIPCVICNKGMSTLEQLQMATGTRAV